MSIKTVIFDIGGVLTNSDWDQLLLEIAPDADKREALIQVLFYSGIWQKLDGGLLNGEEVLAAFLEKGPGLEEEIRAFWEQSGPRLFQLPHTKPLILDLKSKGYQVLYLSNWSEYYRYAAHKAMDFLPLMDGGVFSYEEKVIKPNPEIYQRILRKYDLTPAECVFLDDAKANVEGAIACGIRGIHVKEHKAAHEELYALLGA